MDECLLYFRWFRNLVDCELFPIDVFNAIPRDEELRPQVNGHVLVLRDQCADEIKKFREERQRRTMHAPVNLLSDLEERFTGGWLVLPDETRDQLVREHNEQAIERARSRLPSKVWSPLIAIGRALGFVVGWPDPELKLIGRLVWFHKAESREAAGRITDALREKAALPPDRGQARRRHIQLELPFLQPRFAFVSADDLSEPERDDANSHIVRLHRGEPAVREPTLAMRLWRELVQPVVESFAPFRPQTPGIFVDLENMQIVCNNQEHPVRSEQALRWVKVLSDNRGVFIAAKNLYDYDRELINVRTDKLNGFLPPVVLALIESKPGGGSRLLPTMP